MKDECLSVRSLDLVFGKKPHLAYPLIDQGKSRQEIQKLTGQVVALSGIELSVFRGEILVLMGLSGSGKSSLIRCMNGLNGRNPGELRGKTLFFPKQGGKPVDVQRCDQKTLRSIRRHEVSMVFQNFGLLPWKTVLWNVAFPLKLQGIPKFERDKIALEKLELVGLADWGQRLPGELSGGMQQRVGLARAFSTDANLLLMDEPFSALDPLHRKHLQDELLLLQAKLSKTIVFVTHDFSEALKLGNRIALVENGRILQLGEPHQLIETPACSRVKEFVSHVKSEHSLYSAAAMR